MSSSDPLPKEEVARRRALLRALQEESPEGKLPPERWSYRMAACVLSSFDPETLRPLGRTRDEGGAFRWLMEDCEVVAGTGRWMLKESVRREAIERLGSLKALLKALRRNRVEKPDSLQWFIQEYLRSRDVPDIDERPARVARLAPVVSMVPRASGEESDLFEPTWSDRVLERPDMESVEALADQLQVVRWFGRVVEGEELGTELEEELNRWLAQARLLAPFQKLAGDTFRGRQEELQKLRVHVGVLDRSVTRSLSDYAKRVVGMGGNATLLIHGPGGMGKSALLARFILEHSEEVPFAYLDFDSPQLSLDKPATLLLEASRQLALQYPDSQESLSAFAARCRKALRDERRRRLGGRTSHEKPSHASARGIWEPLAEEFSALLMMQVLHRWAEQGGPYLLLFDTFEEVQYRNADHVKELAHLLSILRRGYPQLRVVLSGRAPEPRLKASELVLQELDEESALLLLEASGVEVPAVRHGLYGQVGGNPLSLKLAAEVVRLEGAEAEGIRDLKTKRLLFFAAREAVVQGQLYRRILEHVHDPVVRKLAHPGLIVRRLTPEVIREVLAEPCGLGDLSLSQAQALFEQLRREVSLVSVGADGALYHRPDVRRVMLEPLRQDQPEKVAAIHAAAVRHYEQRTDVASRAEELYHRLAIGQPREQIEPRWMPGVEGYLRTAVDELPVEAQTYAASHLGLSLSREVWARAQLVDWERHATRRVIESLLKGEPQWALEILHERRARTPGSALYAIEARVLLALGRVNDAEELLGEGLDSVGWDADPVEVLKLLLLRAMLTAIYGNSRQASDMLREADRVATQVGEVARLLPLLVEDVLVREKLLTARQAISPHGALTEFLLRTPYQELRKAPGFVMKAIDFARDELEVPESRSRLDALFSLVQEQAERPHISERIALAAGGATFLEPLVRLLPGHLLAAEYEAVRGPEGIQQLLVGPHAGPPALDFLLNLLA